MPKEREGAKSERECVCLRCGAVKQIFMRGRDGGRARVRCWKQSLKTLYINEQSKYQATAWPYAKETHRHVDRWIHANAHAHPVIP